MRKEKPEERKKREKQNEQNGNVIIMKTAVSKDTVMLVNDEVWGKKSEWMNVLHNCSKIL